MAFFLPYPFAKRFGLNMTQRTTPQAVARTLVRSTVPTLALSFRPSVKAKAVALLASQAKTTEVRGAGDFFPAGLNKLLQGRDAPASFFSDRGGFGHLGTKVEEVTPATDVAGAEAQVAQLEAELQGHQNMLANAKVRRKDCNKVSVVSVVTGGITNLECILRWDGQVAWFNDRIIETEQALLMAQSNLSTLEIAEAQAAVKRDTSPLMKPKPKASQLTKGSGASAGGGGGDDESGGGPSKWLLYGLGALVLGGGAYVIMKAK